MSKMDNNVPKVTVGHFVDEISRIYTLLIEKHWSFSMVPSSFIWGPPGIGKSQAVMQIADAIRKKTHKRVEVIDIRLSIFSPIDLRGVPVADARKEFTVWLKPRIFELDASEGVVNILFFDELSSAPQQVQAAAYQITLDHRIGEHKLPDNCIIIGAGNRTIDKSVVFRMPNALANRLQHYEIILDFSAWRSWAIQNKVHPYVLGYLAFDNSKLCLEEIAAEQIAFPTPRTWMFVSNLLWLMDDSDKIEDMYTRISACVGTDIGLAFIAWCKNHKDLPEVEDIFRGRKTKYPSAPDSLYALIVSMETYVEDREKRDGISQAHLENMAIYASRFPAEYQALLYHDLEQKPGVLEILRNVRLYRDWKRTYNFDI